MRAICVASHHATLRDVCRDQEIHDILALDGFLVELRLDQYGEVDLPDLAEAIKSLGGEHLVVTFRRKDEGGAHETADDEQRVALLMEAIRRGAKYVDVELATLRARPDLKDALWAERDILGRCEIVVSYHDFEGVPPAETLRALRTEMQNLGADVVKIAVKPADIMDGLPLLDLLRDDDTAWTVPLLGLAMGEEGFWSRVLGPLFPNPAPFTFARAEGLGPGPEDDPDQAPTTGTAPGQPTWTDLSALYRYHYIEPHWPVFGVMGHPIAHSLSPLLHNTALSMQDIDGVYLPFKVAGDPVAFVKAFAPRLNLKGLSVTIPHKETVLATCDEIDPLAQRIGALNTLVLREDGTWFGTNTDAKAAADSLEIAWGGEGTLKDRKVLLLGAGGAARALAFAMVERGAEVLIHNRTAERAEKLANDTGARSVSMEEITLNGFEVGAIVNTTSVGMHPNVQDSPLAENQFPKADLVFDTVYNPLHTRLLQLAGARGMKCLLGLAMFVGQGAEQFELFTGQSAPREDMVRTIALAFAGEE